MSEPDQDKTSPRRISIREFRSKMASVLKQVRQGRSFLVTSRDEVLAEIRPPTVALRPPRRPGALRGQIEMAPDFDTLPPEILAAMEGQGDCLSQGTGESPLTRWSDAPPRLP